MSPYRCYRLCFLLVQLLLCSHSIQPIRSQAVDTLLEQPRGGGETTASKTRTCDGGKERKPTSTRGDDGSTVSTASSFLSSSSLSSLVNDWVKQPANKLYQKAKPMVLDLISKVGKHHDVDENELQKRPVEQYEIFGMWRLSLNDGDTILFMEIRPHDLSYGKKHRVAKYTFTPASAPDDNNKGPDSTGKRAKMTKIVNKIAPVSSTIRFLRDDQVYIAKLTRRRILVEDDNDDDGGDQRNGKPTSSSRKKQRTVLKITGRIMENKYSSWWWPKRKLGTFAGIKLAYRELSREQAKIWDSKDDDGKAIKEVDETEESNVVTAGEEDKDEL
jgi:hypothetical protein